MVWKIQDQLGNAMTPKDDEAIYNELWFTFWPNGGQHAVPR